MRPRLAFSHVSGRNRAGWRSASAVEAARRGAGAPADLIKARPAGLEPATPGLGNRCSILLSYGRKGKTHHFTVSSDGACRRASVASAFRRKEREVPICSFRLQAEGKAGYLVCARVGPRGESRAQWIFRLKDLPPKGGSYKSQGIFRLKAEATSGSCRTRDRSGLVKP